jgi:hypothetical protein
MNLLSAPAPSALAVAGFVALALAVAVTALAAVSVAAGNDGRDPEAASRSRSRAAAALAAWMTLTMLLAASGLLSRFDVLPPPLLVLVGVGAVASTALACSGLGRRLALSLPLAALVGFQAFRLPLELILHRLALDGVLPVQMTFDGMNFDFVTGLTAVVVALWAWRGRVPRLVLLAWNLLGLALLVTIVTIAMLSAPVPFRVFWNEPANTIVTTVPFVWLPTMLVPFAWIGHLLVFRRLRHDAAEARR